MATDKLGPGGVPVQLQDPPSASHRVVPMRAPECVTHENQCLKHAAEDDKRWEEHKLAAKDVDTTLVEHRMRLENGSRVFADVKTEIAALRSTLDTLKPKPISWLPIIGLSITILAMVLGSWWALSEKLSARPTTDAVEKSIRVHSEGGHPTTTLQIQQLREEQVKIKATVDATSMDVKDIKQDLRTLSGRKP